MGAGEQALRHCSDQAAKDLRISLILHLPGCFARLSMIRPKRLSTNCQGDWLRAPQAAQNYRLSD
jgi:hypothetical protein